LDGRALVFALAAVAAPCPAAAACQVGKLAELPVTMAGRRPMVTAKFGDKDARFILDSGAFYSTVSKATAAEFALPVKSLPPSFRIHGIGGDASAALATAKSFSLAGIPLPKSEFIVGGSDTGTAGLIGQNILGFADVEYDLPHGAVRLMRTKGCGKVTLAYWAAGRPVTIIPLLDAGNGPFKPHTIGTVMLNGTKIRAVFDTGAETSMLSLAAAKRAGITPDSPGVVAAGFGGGLGSRLVRSWVATFDSIDIGGEAIRRPKIRMSDVDLGNGDMLIGADFFLTHRVFVSNATRTMYITYEGGPMFGLTPRGAVTAAGEKLDLSDKAAEPTDAEGYSRRGAVFASNRKLEEALADFDKAVKLAPADGRYVYQRGMAHLANRQPLLAGADLDRAVALSPNDADARLVRAQMHVARNDIAGAADDLAAADRNLAPSSDKRLTLAALFNETDNHAGAIANYDLWLKTHGDDSSRATAFNGRCWARGLLGQELDKALADCNAALKLRPGTPAFLDSRALVRLRRGETAAALADYDLAVKGAPRNAWSLYARSVAEQRAGKTEQAAADRAAALGINPRVVERGKRVGLEP